MKKLILIISAALFLIACNKEESTICTKITTMSINGVFISSDTTQLISFRGSYTDNNSVHDGNLNTTTTSIVVDCGCD